MSPSWLGDSGAESGDLATVHNIEPWSHHEYYSSDQRLTQTLTLLNHEAVRSQLLSERDSVFIYIKGAKILFKYVTLCWYECKTQEVVFVSVQFLKGQSSPTRINELQHTSLGFFPHGIFFPEPFVKLFKLISD